MKNVDGPAQEALYHDGQCIGHIWREYGRSQPSWCAVPLGERYGQLWPDFMDGRQQRDAAIAWLIETYSRSLIRESADERLVDR